MPSEKKYRNIGLEGDSMEAYNYIRFQIGNKKFREILKKFLIDWETEIRGYQRKLEDEKK